MSPQSPSSSSRRYLSAEERKREILAVAAPLFFTRGYEGTEMAEIAARAGVSRALLHRHFGGKPEILLEIVRSAAAVNPPLNPPERDSPLGDRIARDAEQWLDFFEANPNLLAVTQLPIGGNNEIAGAVDELRECLLARVLDGYLGGSATPEPLRATMRGYVAMILNVAHEWLWRDRITREQVRLTIVTVMSAVLEATVPALLDTLEAKPLRV